MKRKLIIGVMGGGSAEDQDIKNAYKLGALIAKNNWILINGGRNAGIMEASAKGANENGGLTIGILPGRNSTSVSDHIQIPIYTDMGNARNNINILSSDIIVACPGGAGTLSEIALALKNKKTVIFLDFDIGNSFDRFSSLIHVTKKPEETISVIQKLALN